MQTTLERVDVFQQHSEYKQAVRRGIPLDKYYITKDGVVLNSKTNRILKQSKCGNKNNYDNVYWSVNISIKGVVVTTAVHRLVIETWKPIDEYPPDELKDDRENNDCITIFKDKVTEAGLLSDDDINKLDEEVNSLIEESVDQAKKSPLPNPEDVTKDVYVSY